MPGTLLHVGILKIDKVPAVLELMFCREETVKGNLKIIRGHAEASMM